MRAEESRFRYILAEDEPRIRSNIVKKIGQTGLPFKLVGEAEDGNTALELADRFNPHLLITDIRMPVLDGIELISRLYYARPDVKVVIISGYDDFAYTRPALKFGVMDYILKPVNVKDLKDILSRVLVKLQEDTDAFKENRLSYPEHTAHETLARDAAEYIRNHFAKPASLESISGLFHVNPSYLSRVFKEHTGIPLMKFIQDLRIGEAKRLLVDYPDLEIKEIASIVGYTDQCYFSRIFKKNMKVSPQEYREKP